MRKVPTVGACSRLIIPGSSLRYFLNLQVIWVRMKDITVSSVLPSQMSFPVRVLGLWGLSGVEGHLASGCSVLISLRLQLPYGGCKERAERPFLHMGDSFGFVSYEIKFILCLQGCFASHQAR